VITNPPETPARAAARQAWSWVSRIEGLIVLHDQSAALDLIRDALLPQLAAMAASANELACVDRVLSVVTGELKDVVDGLKRGSQGLPESARWHAPAPRAGSRWL
jgi:hypothetical protein